MGFKLWHRWFNLPKFNLVEKYNPYHLQTNIDEFNRLLNEWKNLYIKFQINVEEYDSIEELYDNKQNKTK